MAVMTDESQLTERQLRARVSLAAGRLRKAQTKLAADWSPKRAAKVARLRAELSEALAELRACAN